MAWIKPEYSKSQVEKAGKNLIKYPAGSPNYEKAVQVTNNWRAAHAFPLNTLRILLAKKGMEIESEAIVVQRLKRFESIKEKQKRAKEKNNSSNLARMQDLGGCRVIFFELESVYKLIDALNKLNPKRFTHRLIKTDDYIKTPQISGYRGVHLVYEYHGPRAIEYDGLKIEIQIRTFLQHLWATTVETTSLITKTSLKASDGPEEWLRFFALVSSVFAYLEGCSLIPNTPSTLGYILNEIDELNEKYRFYDQLKAYQTFVSSVENKDMQEGAYYLLVIDYAASIIRIIIYSKDDSEIATNKYNEIEHNQDGIVNDAVLISASSLNNIKRAYPNYFNDIRGFLSLLSAILDRKMNENTMLLEIEEAYTQMTLQI